MNELSNTARLLLTILRVHGKRNNDCPVTIMQLSCLSWILGCQGTHQVMLACLRDIVDCTILSTPRSFNVGDSYTSKLLDDEQELLRFFDTLLNDNIAVSEYSIKVRTRINRLLVALCLIRDKGFGGNNGNNMFKRCAPQQAPQSSSTQWKSKHHLQHSHQLYELSMGESYLLHTTRLWATAIKNGMDTRTTLVAVHAHLGSHTAATFINNFLNAILFSGKRTLDIACFCQSTLTNDEVRLMATFAALQQHHGYAAEYFAQPLLSPLITQRLAYNSSALSNGLAAANIYLPQRSWIVDNTVDVKKRDVMTLDEFADVDRVLH